MAELLIYFVPIFVGVIGSPYLGRLGNFILMMLIFEFDIAVLLGMSRPWAFILTPYTPLFIIPALAGMLGDTYLGMSKYIIAVGVDILMLATYSLPLLTLWRSKEVRLVIGKRQTLSQPKRLSIGSNDVTMLLNF